MSLQERNQEPPAQELPQEAARAYLELNDQLRLLILPAWLSADLTLSQAKAIFLLTYYGAQTVSELAERIGVGRPAASILVQGLVEQGLARREEDPRDRRRALVALTPSGERLIVGPQEQRLKLLAECMQELDRETLSGLLGGLRALARTVKRRNTAGERSHS